VLVDGDDMNEPIADAARSILDGHIVLTRSLAHAGHYPAIDVLQSVSRLIGEVVSPEVRSAGQALRGALAAHREKEDLISIGAYQSGTDPVVDAAITHKRQIDGFLRQRVDEPSSLEEADAQLLALGAALGDGSAPGSLAADAIHVPQAAQPAATVPVGSPTGAPTAIPALSLGL